MFLIRPIAVATWPPYAHGRGATLPDLRNTHTKSTENADTRRNSAKKRSEPESVRWRVTSWVPPNKKHSGCSVMKIAGSAPMRAIHKNMVHEPPRFFLKIYESKIGMSILLSKI